KQHNIHPEQHSFPTRRSSDLLKLDEYAGDYAAAKNDDAWAVAAWKKVAEVDPKDARLWEKIARLEKRHHFWTKEDAAWSALLSVDRKSTRLNSSHSQISYAVF